MTSPGEPTGSKLTPPRSRAHQTWRVFGLVIALLIVFLVVRQLVRGWDGVGAYPWRFRPLLALASLAAIQTAYFTLGRSWRSVLRAVEIRLTYRRAYWLFYISNLGRYIPGKIWQIGAAAWLGGRLGLPGHEVAASMVVHMLYFLPVGAVIALAAGPFPPPYDTTAIQILAWSATVAAGAVALWPYRVMYLLSRSVRRVKIDPDRWRFQLSRRLGIIAQTAFAWVCMSGSFALFVMSVTPVDASHLPELARIYIASHILGYVALLAPGGLGVREGVLAILLTPLVGAGPAAGLALLSRLWSTVSELIALAPASVWAYRDREPSRDAVPPEQSVDPRPDRH